MLIVIWGETMGATKYWYNNWQLTRASKQAVDDRPERFAIETLRTVLALTEELIVDLKERGVSEADLRVLRSRALIVEEQINELSALFT